MISVVERDNEKRAMLEICRRSPFGCKIAGIALAYGFDKRFSMFWMDSECEAVYSLVDGIMMITGTVRDAGEALSFIRFSGAEEISCALRNLEILGLNADEYGDILRKKTDGESEAFTGPQDVPIREIYALLEETGLIEVGEEDDEAFEAFYLDLSHRVRHGIACVITKRVEGTLAGCAVLSSVTGGTAILSAVAVREQFRRQGMGTQLVEQVETILPGRTLYVYKETAENNEFYRSLGFSKTDTWVQKAVVRRSTENGAEDVNRCS